MKYYRILRTKSSVDDYDANGNMVRDDNRGIVHIDYNVLNLPQTISFFSGDRLDYVYDALGTKLAVEYTPADVDGYSLTALPVAAVGADEPVPAGLFSIGTAMQRRDYFAGCEWENGVFTRMNTPYGYHDGTAYYARIPDYQGNVMAVVKAGTDKSAQSNYYYPYGLPTAMSSHPEVNRYKYGGKELEMSHGLTLYDFEARWHDPQTARFLQPDPMADDYPWLSPYTYCAGNPIRNIDPTGKFILSVENQRRYPHFTQYLKHEMPKVADNKRIANALMKNGERTFEQLKNELTFGSGPEIIITNEINTHGQFTSGKGEESLKVNYNLILNLEADGNNKAMNKINAMGNLQLLGATILHEYTHWGDAQDGVQRRNENMDLIEDGENFEIDAYGMIISFESAMDLIRKYCLLNNINFIE